MPDLDHRAGLFPALLKHWRGQRGLSQLDLALAADVSSRHVSFLETGRSRPSAEMVLRLGATLGVPLRHVNAMLRAAGHEAVYDDDREVLPPSVQQALDLLKSHQEPYPLIVMDRAYTVRDLNQGAVTLLAALVGDADAVLPAVADGLNLARFTFDPAGRAPVRRQHRRGRPRPALAPAARGAGRPGRRAAARRARRRARHARRSTRAGARSTCRCRPSPPLVVHLRAGDLDLRFITMVTAFQAPQNAAVEDLAIEAWFPADDATAELMRSMAAG